MLFEGEVMLMRSSLTARLHMGGLLWLFLLGTGACQEAGWQPGRPAPLGEPINLKAQNVKWERMMPDLGEDSPELAVLHVHPVTQATHLMIRTRRPMHVPPHWHSSNETHTVLFGAAAFQLGETVTLRQILVPTLNEARDVRRRLLKEPRSFERQARSVSRGPEAPSGGLIGTFARGQLPAELEAPAFALAAGATSDIVSTSLGYHILRVEARQPARTEGLEEAQARIRARLVREKTDRKMRELVASLLQRAKVNHAAALSLPRRPS